MFHVTQNETPKMAKMAVSTNQLSRLFAEHVREVIYRKKGLELFLYLSCMPDRTRGCRTTEALAEREIRHPGRNMALKQNSVPKTMQ